MATMTVARLHKMLGQLIEEGQGRRPVVMNKASFYHPLESDGVALLDVTEAKADTITMANDDGDEQGRQREDAQGFCPRRRTHAGLTLNAKVQPDAQGLSRGSAGTTGCASNGNYSERTDK